MDAAIRELEERLNAASSSRSAGRSPGRVT
jgi:hypothetical protein